MQIIKPYFCYSIAVTTKITNNKRCDSFYLSMQFVKPVPVDLYCALTDTVV